MKHFEKYRGVTLNGKYLSASKLESGHLLRAAGPNTRAAIRFVSELFSEKDELFVTTSGSTGSPKEYAFPKSAFEQSALATLSFFQLNSEATALLPLPMEYIAAKMMVTRAVIGGFNLIIAEPSSTPLKADFQPDFIPVTPFQMREILARQSALINHQTTFLIGGGPVDEKLKTDITQQQISAYASFGMTETLSHFALAHVDNHPLVFKTLPGVEVKQSEFGALSMKWPGIVDEWLVTNDIVEFRDDGFVWLGRSDFLINSGGIKIIPEQVESKLRKHLDLPFFIHGVPDESLGEKAALFIEGEKGKHLDFLDIVTWQSKYHRPKEVVYIPQFIRTESGKIKRAETVESWQKTQPNPGG